MPEMLFQDWEWLFKIEPSLLPEEHHDPLETDPWVDLGGEG